MPHLREALQDIAVQFVIANALLKEKIGSCTLLVPICADSPSTQQRQKHYLSYCIEKHKAEVMCDYIECEGSEK